MIKKSSPVLKIIPLIEKHFAPFEGQRASIQSGLSAKFVKVKRAFQEECATVSKMRISVNESTYSYILNMDINERDPRSDCAVNYFKTYTYIGESKNGDFFYTFKPDELRTHCDTILSLTAQQLQQAKNKIDDLYEQAEKIIESFPFTVRDLIKPR